MVARLGIDVARVAGWAARLDRTPAIEVVAFTPGERAWCRGRPTRLAMCWAAKEAVGKALGTGFDGLGWRGLELVGAARAAPVGWVRRTGLDRPAWPVRFAVTDAVVVALTAEGARRQPIATAITTGLGGTGIVGGPRADRASRASRAVRDAAERALDVLLPDSGRARDVRWATTAAGAPRLWVGGTEVAVSLAHDGGVVAAAVAAPAGWPAPPLGVSTA